MKRKEKYDLIHEQHGFERVNSSHMEEDVDIEIDIEPLKEVLDEVGISFSSDNLYSLILWNDDVHDMLEIVLALYEICGLNNEDAMRVMLEAHNKGKAIVKSGSFNEMYDLKQKLNGKTIDARVEL